MSKQTLVLAPAAFNLAEVTRMLEIAKASRDTFNVVFLSYDATGRNHHFIEDEGFEIRRMRPEMTADQVDRMFRIDRGDEFGSFLPVETILERVESELALFRELEPAAVLTGFCLSIPLSARLGRVPLVWVIQTTWLVEYLEKYATWPDVADVRPLRLVPRVWLDRLTRRFAPFIYLPLYKSFNKAAKRLGLPKFRGSEFFEGDFTLFAEPPEFTGIPIPKRLAGRSEFIGPLIARLPIAMPPELEDIPRDRPIVYLAMGSSGAAETVAEVIMALGDQPYTVISPVRRLLGDLDITAPPNVIVTDWLPADKVNPMADVSVIHGGIGTVMTACMSGTPIVGIPNGNPEQEANIEAIVRKGFGIHLHKRRIDAGDVVAAVDRMLADESAKEKAREFQTILEAWHDPKRATRFLSKALSNKP